MSQTETILLVVLGFSLASLIALFIGRMMWSTAVRIGARRMQRQVPSSVVGLQTERDRLRAEYAMLSQRLGSRIETMKITMAEHMAEVSRHRNRLEQVEKENAGRGAELERLEQEKAQLASTVERLTAELEEARSEARGLRDRLDAAELATAGAMATPPAAAVEAATEPEPRTAPAGDDGDRLRQRIERLNRMASAVAKDRARPGLPDTIILPPPPPPSDPLVIEKLAEAERETGDLQRELERLDAEWSKRLEAEKASRTETPAASGEDGKPAEAPDGKEATFANVISLANRLRELRKGLNKP